MLGAPRLTENGHGLAAEIRRWIARVAIHPQTGIRRRKSTRRHATLCLRVRQSAHFARSIDHADYDHSADFQQFGYMALFHRLSKLFNLRHERVAVVANISGLTFREPSAAPCVIIMPPAKPSGIIRSSAAAIYRSARVHLFAVSTIMKFHRGQVGAEIGVKTIDLTDHDTSQLSNATHWI